MADRPFGFTVATSSPIDILQNITFTEMAQLGGGSCAGMWMRFQVAWSYIEQQQTGPSTYVWTQVDDAVQKCNANGVNYIFVVQNAPAWHLANLCSGDPTKGYLLTADTAQFVRDVCNRYNGGANGHIEAIEIGNEGYTDSSVLSCKSSAFLAPVLAACYPIIKSLLPGCLVGCASQNYKSISLITSWCQALFDNGAGDAFDYWNFHFYNGQFAPSDNRGNSDQPTFDQFWQTIQSVSVANGRPTRRCRVTEYGWPVSGSPNVTQQQQSDYNLYCLQSAARSGFVDHMLWFTLAGQNGFSLTNVSGGVVNQYYTAFATEEAFIAANPNLTGYYGRFLAHA